jgi:polygalacturonase
MAPPGLTALSLATPMNRAPSALLSTLSVLCTFKAVALAAVLLACAGSLCGDPQDRSRFVVTRYGAVGDSRTLSTANIQAAIDAAAAAGGGTVVLPRGTFLSGSLFLRQGVNLTLEEGAVLLGSNRIEDYPRRPTRIEGHTEVWRMALVNAEGLSGVRVKGPGVIDGNGILFWAAFWQRRKENPDCTNLEVERPRMMHFANCTGVRIEALSLRDSGFWNVHLYRCRDVVLEGVRIHSPTRGNILAPSTDGVDIDSSRDVTLRHCSISVDDDNIALKGSKGPQADHDPSSPPVENIRVEDCEFGDGNAVLTCGSEATVVRNVTVRNIVVNGDNTVLALKLRPDTPQHYEHILIDGVRLSGPGQIVRVAPWTQFFDLHGNPPPGRQVNDIVLRNITGSFRSFGEVMAGEREVVRDIRFENVNVTLAEPQLRSRAVERLVFSGVVVNGAPAEAPSGRRD